MGEEEEDAFASLRERLQSDSDQACEIMKRNKSDHSERDYEKLRLHVNLIELAANELDIFE